VHTCTRNERGAGREQRQHPSTLGLSAASPLLDLTPDLIPGQQGFAASDSAAPNGPQAPAKGRLWPARRRGAAAGCVLRSQGRRRYHRALSCSPAALAPKAASPMPHSTRRPQEGMWSAATKSPLWMPAERNAGRAWVPTVLLDYPLLWRRDQVPRIGASMAPSSGELLRSPHGGVLYQPRAKPWEAGPRAGQP